MPESSVEPGQLAIISGRSGSGKSTALHVLEDAGYYCIDNLPAGLLPELVNQTLMSDTSDYHAVAVCIDARNISADLSKFAGMLHSLPEEIKTNIIYLDANGDELIKRFSETRRKHPLSNRFTALKEAVEAERELLAPIADASTLIIDTSQMNIYELRDIIKSRVVGDSADAFAILFQSFGFKRGLPNNVDIVYDVRCLPNPYWRQELRAQNGLDDEVVAFLNETRRCQRNVLRLKCFSGKVVSSVRTQQPRLYDRRHRLHRRATSLGVHEPAFERTFRRQVQQRSGKASRTATGC